MTLDVALTPDPGIAGKVLTPSGAPAGGAVLAICTWTNEVTVEGGKLKYIGHGQQLGRLGTTVDDGTFRLRGEVGPWVLVVAHDSGYAEVLSTDLAKSPNIRLRPWGRVEGEFAINGKPVANQAIYVGAGRGDVPVVLSYDYSVTTDAAGRFSLDRIPPVSLYIEPSFQRGTSSFMLLPSSGRITIAAGQTTRIALPRAGRA